MSIANLPAIRACRPAWNKERIVGQKRPLLPKHVWASRVRFEIAGNARDPALFNLAIDSKLRGCDLARLKVADVYAASQVKQRASIIQSKTQKPVRFEISEGTRKSLASWLDELMMVGPWPMRCLEATSSNGLDQGGPLFPDRFAALLNLPVDHAAALRPRALMGLDRCSAAECRMGGAVRGRRRRHPYALSGKPDAVFEGDRVSRLRVGDGRAPPLLGRPHGL